MKTLTNEESHNSTMQIYVTSERLILRDFTDSDTESFMEYRNDSEITKYQGWDGTLTQDEANDFVHSQSQLDIKTLGKWKQIAIQVGESHVGDCAFINRDGNAEVGITISKEHQRFGYAREALQGLYTYLFSELKVHRIIAITDTENKSSIRLMEKLNMRREAHFVKSYFDKTMKEWRDEFQFAIISTEWT